MKYRNFGHTDISVSELSFGAMRATGDAAHVPRAHQPTREELDQANSAGRRALEAALDGGVNCIHSSEDYGTWWMIGATLAHHPKRHDIHHVIKVSSPDYDDSTFDPSIVRRDVESALRALHTERITFVQHLQRGPHVSPDDAYSPAGDDRRIGALPTIAEEFAAIISDLRDEGKVAHGITFPHTMPYAKAALNTGAYDGVAHFFNLLETEGMEILDSMVERGYGYFAIRPLLQGMLTDKRVNRASLPTSDPMTLPIWDSRYALLEKIRETIGDPPDSWAAYATRFALAHPGITSVITSANSETQVTGLLTALDRDYPSEETLRTVASLVSKAGYLSKFDLFPQNQITDTQN